MLSCQSLVLTGGHLQQSLKYPVVLLKEKPAFTRQDMGKRGQKRHRSLPSKPHVGNQNYTVLLAIHLNGFKSQISLLKEENRIQVKSYSSATEVSKELVLSHSMISKISEWVMAWLPEVYRKVTRGLNTAVETGPMNCVPLFLLSPKGKRKIKKQTKKHLIMQFWGQDLMWETEIHLRSPGWVIKASDRRWAFPTQRRTLKMTLQPEPTTHKSWSSEVLRQALGSQKPAPGGGQGCRRGSEAEGPISPQLTIICV